MPLNTIPNKGLTSRGYPSDRLVTPIIINGDMSIAQRGTSSTSSGYATVDRMNISRDATSLTQSQESLSSSDSPYSLGFRKYFRVTNTGTSSATDTYVAITQRIEAQNIATSGWNYTSSSSSITISFWVRSSLAGTYYCTPRTQDGTSYNYAFPIVLTANTWTKITKSIIGNSNLTINNDHGNGLSLRIWPHLGSDFTTSSHTTNQWNVYSASDQAPDYSQNWRNTSSATFDITGLQLEVGEFDSTSIPSFPFESFESNLRKCQRYYFCSDTVTSGTEFYPCFCPNSGDKGDSIKFTAPVSLRSPDNTTLTVSAGTSQLVGGGYSSTTTVPSFTRRNNTNDVEKTTKPSGDGTKIYFVSSAIFSGISEGFAGFGTTGTIEFDNEL
tara:strand:+ start:133 stop:1287 length:1155 start_codon:yes stop_codon:yes gene_type:complete